MNSLHRERPVCLIRPIMRVALRFIKQRKVAVRIERKAMMLLTGKGAEPKLERLPMMIHVADAARAMR